MRERHFGRKVRPLSHEIDLLRFLDGIGTLCGKWQVQHLVPRGGAASTRERYLFMKLHTCAADFC